MSSHTTPARTLAGRRALVTGAAGGIGEACARELAARGAEVTVADNDGAGAVRVAKDIGGLPWKVDLSDTGALEDITLDLDILVNNAGLQRLAPLHDYEPADWRLLHRVMLEAPFLLIRAALPGMYARRFGRIINITSTHGLRASPFKGAYVAAKHGLEGLSKVAALEGAPHGVTSNCIAPGYVRTALVERQIADQAKLHGITEDAVLSTVLLAESAIKRLVEPHEVASLAAWLAADDAGMVTGASYTMDGGWTCR